MNYGTVVSVNWRTKMVPKRPLIGKAHCTTDCETGGLWSVVWNDTVWYLAVLSFRGVQEAIKSNQIET